MKNQYLDLQNHLSYYKNDEIRYLDLQNHLFHYKNNEKSIYWPPVSPDAPAPKLPLYTGDNYLNWKKKNINETPQYDEVANLDFEASAAGDIESNSES